jgi:hypothetical protein
MLVFALGLGLTVVLLAKVSQWQRSHAAELGSMSHQWVAAFHASAHASSI